MNTRAPAILDHLASLADTTRSRLLLLLDRNELTVSELCGITQLPQSTVSRHLKALVGGGWITSRAEGTSALPGGGFLLEAATQVSQRRSGAPPSHQGRNCRQAGQRKSLQRSLCLRGY